MQLDVDVEKQFEGFRFATRFSISNSRCGVFGPSGSGKSTLMNMLAGLLPPETGKIVLNERTLFDSENKINLTPDKRRVGVVFQHAHLFPHMSVKNNLFYGSKRQKDKNKKREKIDPAQLLSVLQLEALMNRNVTKLSGGEKQRVALGRAILAGPELILLDEPLTGLDGTLKFQIIPHLQRVFSKCSIPMLFISHSLQEMRLMTDEVLVMGKGKIERQLTTEELARTSLGTGGRGYTNLLQLGAPVDRGNLFSCTWGKVNLMLVKTHNAGSGIFRLRGRDILLFKKHPQATSARNMLSCTVCNTYQTDWLVGVELDCRGNTLVAEIVPQSVEELDIKPGSEVIAVIKASAFQRLC